MINGEVGRAAGEKSASRGKPSVARYHDLKNVTKSIVLVPYFVLIGVSYRPRPRPQRLNGRVHLLLETLQVASRP